MGGGKQGPAKVAVLDAIVSRYGDSGPLSTEDRSIVDGCTACGGK